MLLLPLPVQRRTLLLLLPLHDHQAPTAHFVGCANIL